MQNYIKAKAMASLRVIFLLSHGMGQEEGWEQKAKMQDRVQEIQQ